MCKLSLSFIFLLILFPNSVFAQREGVVHPRFKVLLKSGESIEGKNGYFTSTTFNGNLNNGQEINIDRSDIQTLDVLSGSKMLPYAAIGAGAGILASLALWSMSSDSSEVGELGETWGGGEFDVNLGIVMPLLGVAGAVVGGFIGAKQPEWTRVSLKTAFLLGPKEKGAMLTVSIQF